MPVRVDGAVAGCACSLVCDDNSAITERGIRRIQTEANRPHMSGGDLPPKKPARYVADPGSFFDPGGLG